jgi:hypothetical protein
VRGFFQVLLSSCLQHIGQVVVQKLLVIIAISYFNKKLQFQPNRLKDNTFHRKFIEAANKNLRSDIFDIRLNK